MRKLACSRPWCGPASRTPCLPLRRSRRARAKRCQRRGRPGSRPSQGCLENTADGLG